VAVTGRKAVRMTGHTVERIAFGMNNSDQFLLCPPITSTLTYTLRIAVKNGKLEVKRWEAPLRIRMVFGDFVNRSSTSELDDRGEVSTKALSIYWASVS
jgi:hypothetical protein